MTVPPFDLSLDVDLAPASSPAQPAPGLAVIVLAHRDAPQVRRLIDALAPFPVLLHCAASISGDDIRAMTADLPARCVVQPRINTGREEWDDVIAEAEAYRIAIATTGATHFAVLSGTDYPVVPADDMATILQRFPGTTLAATVRSLDSLRQKPSGSIRSRHRPRNVRRPHSRESERERAEDRSEPTMRVISRQHAQRVLAAFDSRPSLIEPPKHNDDPREHPIAAILDAIADESSADGVTVRPLPWMVVPGRGDGAGTSGRDAEHLRILDALRSRQDDQPGFLFVRGFSSEHSAELLDAVDAALRHAPAGNRAPLPVDDSADATSGRNGVARGATDLQDEASGGDHGMRSDGTSQGAPPAADSSGLFGRGMLYVVVWSLQLVAGTVVSPIVAHLLGAGEFGALAAGIALFQVLSVVALLGLDQAVVLQRAEDGNDTASRGLLSAGIAISALITLTVAVTSPLWSAALGFGGVSSLVLAVIVWTVPGAAVQMILALLLSQDRLRDFSLVSALAAVGGQLVGLGLLIFVQRDAAAYAWGGVIAQFAAMGLGLALARPKLDGLVNAPVTRRAVKLGVPLAIGSLAFTALNAGDRLVIQTLLGAAEVGRYQVAYVVGSVVIILLTATSAAWIPRIAAVHDPVERWRFSAETRDGLYRLLCPMIIGIALGAPVVLRVVAPADFEPDGLLIVVLLVALAAFPVAESGATTRLLTTLRRGRTIAVIAGIAAVSNIGLNIALVPVMGISGSALATLVAFTLLAVLQARSLPAEPRWRGPGRRLVMTMLVCVVVATASVLLPQTTTFNVIRFAAALCCLPWFWQALSKARKS